jgi:hypothetical protein
LYAEVEGKKEEREERWAVSLQPAEAQEPRNSERKEWAISKPTL